MHIFWILFCVGIKSGLASSRVSGINFLWQNTFLLAETDTEPSGTLTLVVLHSLRAAAFPGQCSFCALPPPSFFFFFPLCLIFTLLKRSGWLTSVRRILSEGLLAGRAQRGGGRCAWPWQSPCPPATRWYRTLWTLSACSCCHLMPTAHPAQLACPCPEEE